MCYNVGMKIVKRIIKSHKGGRTIRLNTAFTPDEAKEFEEWVAVRGMVRADWILEMVKLDKEKHEQGKREMSKVQI